MPSPNRILIALFIIIALIDIVMTTIEGTSVVDLIIGIVIVYTPMIIAFNGRGGKIIYYTALLISWLLGAFLLVAIIALIMIITEQPEAMGIYDIAMMLMISALGIASYYCITRTHPLGQKTELQQAKRKLNNELLFALGLMFISNIALIATSSYAGWSFVEVMWVYWIQSMIVGYFNVLTILNLRQFDRSEFEISGVGAEATDEEFKKASAKGFAIHYGAIHLFYMVFILALTSTPSAVNLLFIAILSAFYFGTHFYEYHSSREERDKSMPHIGKLFARPYIRVVPMHLTIILGLGFMGGHKIATLVLFILIKMIMDATLEIWDYRQRRKDLHEAYATRSASD